MPGSSILRVLALAILVGGLLPATVPGPVVARGARCPERHAVTVRDLLELAPYGTSSYGGANPRAHACFGGATITIRGFANWPDGLGGTSTSGIRPTDFEWPTFFLFASSRESRARVRPGRVRRARGAAVPQGGGPVPPRLGRRDGPVRRPALEPLPWVWPSG
jgi:hypothetical protein